MMQRPHAGGHTDDGWLRVNCTCIGRCCPTCALGVSRTATAAIAAGIGYHLAFRTTAQLFLGEGAVLDETGSTVLEVFALGGVPFTPGWMAMLRVHRDRIDRSTPGP